ncbi:MULTISPECIES: hypothetical protein [Rhizobium]|uniref:Uncharacterized protein n=1 Tax=Rhizobium favelukesii TaxID=348824 RepID=W6RN85_9HYPH|nr:MULTISPECIES: hypothetical protein [Rhizobium]MCA0805612.1 hypothetical protein [Rhizobium sp. T1473]MCS0459227.1 hypothetical protein [Rhizobium favelukesii]UFS79048.1 hypothetical protein LPB79_05360 [Rhizobium sp. T136]CDM62542.1 hypothetical protein LPU83_pLPU83d_1172 [Rhizobium favelukesii]
MLIKTTPTRGSELITPKDQTLVPTAFGSQVSFPTKSIVPINLRNQPALISNAAVGFGVHSTTMAPAKKNFSGSIFSQITDLKGLDGALERVCWAV